MTERAKEMAEGGVLSERNARGNLERRASGGPRASSTSRASSGSAPQPRDVPAQDPDFAKDFRSSKKSLRKSKMPWTSAAESDSPGFFERVCNPCKSSGKRHGCKDMVAYFLDRVFVKRWAFFLFLTVVGLIMIAVFGFLYALVIEEDWSQSQANDMNIYIEGVWAAWTFMADPGTHADVTTSSQRILGSIITLGGILFFASILGVTVDIIHEKMDALRQGKSKIVESGHSLILGWTEKTFHIVEELVEANSSEGGGVIAILASESKERMEEELKIQIPQFRRRGTRVVVRTGSPLVVNDLVRVSVHMAKAVIILAGTGDADRSDADTLRAMLTLRNMFRSSDTMRGYVVAEVRDIDNEPLVKMVGGDSVETLVSHDMIGRLMLMSVRQPGLAKVYEALLGFEGDEFYMSEWKELEGKQWAELVGSFADAVPIGILGADGFVVLNPPAGRKLGPGDQVIVIAQDNDTYKPQEPVPIEGGTPPEMKPHEKKREIILFCGWRRDVRDILQQLDKLVDPGSEVHMMTHCVPVEKRAERLLEDGLDTNDLVNIKLVHHFGNTSVRRKLEALPLEHYSSVMIFADQMYEADTMHADSHSLATLLLIRNIQAVRQANGSLSSPRKRQPQSARFDQLKDQTCPMICEILDPHTQKTIAESDHLSLASDFCQSNRLIAQVMTMVAEERTVKVLLGELLGSQGVCIHVVPPTRYTRYGEQLSFWALCKRALTCFNETVIGYQQRNSTAGTVLNPANKHKPFVWDRCDFAVLQGEMSQATYFVNTDEDHPALQHVKDGSVPAEDPRAGDAPRTGQESRSIEQEDTHEWATDDPEARSSHVVLDTACRRDGPAHRAQAGPAIFST